MLEGLQIGLSTAFSLTNLLLVIGGCLIGTFIGMLPGLGPMSILAIMIPVAITSGDPSVYHQLTRPRTSTAHSLQPCLLATRRRSFLTLTSLRRSFSRYQTLC